MKAIVELPNELYEKLLNSGVINPTYLKEIKIDDSFLKDDITYQNLKKQSNKLYKELVTYRFKKLNNIK